MSGIKPWYAVATPHEDIREGRQASGGRLPDNVKGVAVFTNQTCDATQGELAFQLCS